MLFQQYCDVVPVAGITALTYAIVLTDVINNYRPTSASARKLTIVTNTLQFELVTASMLCTALVVRCKHLPLRG